MAQNTQIREKLLLLFGGGALVAAGMVLSHRPEAAAVTPLPKAEDLSATFRYVASEAIPSVVSIESSTKPQQLQGHSQASPLNDNSPLRPFFRNDPFFEDFFKNRGPRGMVIPQRKAMGSGFIINANGTILTNTHVVKGADEVKVRLHDGSEYIAKDIKMDPRTDVAILRIEAAHLKPIRLGDSRVSQVGDWVLAIGSPFGLDMSVTAGIISAKGRSGRITERADFLQTDAAINPGNSGGPLINMNGEVIGINTAIATESGAYDGVGFAIPTHIASWVSEQLIAAGEVRRGYLGTQIQEVDAKLAKQFNIKVHEGAIVHSVMPGSPADKAGVEPGDVVLSLNGQKIDSPIALQGFVEQLTIGKSYPLEIIRNGKRQTLHVTIEKLPQESADGQHEERQGDDSRSKFDKFGFELRTLTPDLGKQFNLKATSGVVVIDVLEGSAADQAGIKAGDVIEKAGGMSLNAVEDYEKAKTENKSSDGLVLNVRSPNGRRFFVVLKVE